VERADLGERAGHSKAQLRPGGEAVSDLWTPGSFSRGELASALVLGRVACEEVSHDRADVLWKARRLAEGDPRLQFGIEGLAGKVPWTQVLAWVAEEAGFDPDPSLGHGPVPVDPERVLDRLEEAGERLAVAAREGARILLATGHPSGLIELDMALAGLLARSGASLLRPLEGRTWRVDGHRQGVRYVGGVAFLSWGGSAMHTHSPEPMERMLEEARPDLVFADHGFAGAAIQAGVETVSIADVNDPALVVAKRLGRTRTVIVMDDNVEPADYWPCFQAIAARFPHEDGGR
jgi:hypothetical protein